MAFAMCTAAAASGRPVSNFQSASAVVQRRWHLHALKAYLILTGQTAAELTAAYAGCLPVDEEHAQVPGASTARGAARYAIHTTAVKRRSGRAR